MSVSKRDQEKQLLKAEIKMEVKSELLHELDSVITAKIDGVLQNKPGLTWKDIWRNSDPSDILKVGSVIVGLLITLGISLYRLEKVITAVDKLQPSEKTVDTTYPNSAQQLQKRKDTGSTQ